MSTVMRQYAGSSSGRRVRRPRSRGFTLIELMIVVAIVAILAAIAYPSYMDQVRKSRRGDAEGVLMQGAQWMERFYTSNNRYADATEYQNQSGLAKSPIEGGLTYYTIVAARPTPNTFTLTATPAGSQVGERCGALTLNQVGQKGVGALTVDQCW